MDYDKMVLVKGLVDYGWSFRRIGKLLNHSHNTVKTIYFKALELSELGELTESPKGKGGVDLRYVGNSHDLEYIDAQINHNVCGGGRKVNNVSEA